MLEACRRSVPAFVEYAFQVENAPIHLRWQELLSTHRRLVLMAPVGHGKTMQVAIAKSLHMIGDNPNLRGAIFTDTLAHSRKVIGEIRRQIEANKRIKEVFPHLKIPEHPPVRWDRYHMLTVDRSPYLHEPTLQGLPVGRTPVSSRLDFVILDDVLDASNTSTSERRNAMLKWFEDVVKPRLMEGASCWLVGTPRHPNDLLHRVVQREGWFCERISAIENFGHPTERWRTTWMPKERLVKIYQEMEFAEFYRRFLCRV